MERHYTEKADRAEYDVSVPSSGSYAMEPSRMAVGNCRGGGFQYPQAGRMRWSLPVWLWGIAGVGGFSTLKRVVCDGARL